MNGIKKVALFLSGLDYTEADRLMSRLDAVSQKMIRREMRSLRFDSISAEQTHRLDEEFLHTAGWQPAPPYREYQFAASKPATYVPQQPRTPYTAEAFVPPVRSFSFMRNWSVSDVVNALIDEQPQTIAIVLAHLPQSQMNSVLPAFPPELQREIKQRLDHYALSTSGPDEQIVQEIESALQIRYRRQHRPERRSAALKTFEDIETLSDPQLAKLFHSVDLTTAMLALIGADTTLIARITKTFSPTEEHEMRKRLKQLDRIHEDDVAQAQEYILEQYNGTLLPYT